MSNSKKSLWNLFYPEKFQKLKFHRKFFTISTVHISKYIIKKYYLTNMNASLATSLFEYDPMNRALKEWFNSSLTSCNFQYEQTRYRVVLFIIFPIRNDNSSVIWNNCFYKHVHKYGQRTWPPKNIKFILFLLILILKSSMFLLIVLYF